MNSSSFYLRLNKTHPDYSVSADGYHFSRACTITREYSRSRRRGRRVLKEVYGSISRAGRKFSGLAMRIDGAAGCFKGYDAYSAYD